MNNHKTNPWPMFCVAAFLLGILGTAFVMRGHGHSTSPVSAVQSDGDVTDAKKDGDATDAGSGADSDGDAATKGLVKLTPAGAASAGIRIERAHFRLAHATLSVPGTVAVAANRAASISPPVSGSVVRLYVAAGDAVRRGQPLATLDSPEIAQARAQILAAVATDHEDAAQTVTARAQLRQDVDDVNSALSELRRQKALAQAGAFSQSPLQAALGEKSQAQGELQRGDAELANRSVIVQRDAKLLAAGVVSKAEYDQARTDQAESQSRVIQDQARLQIAEQALARERSVFGQGLLNQQAIQSAQSKLILSRGQMRGAQAQLSAAITAEHGAADAVTSAQLNLQALTGGATLGSHIGQITLLSPISGVVAQQSVTLGQTVERSSVLFVVDDLTHVLVDAHIAESEIGRVRVGEAVSATVSSWSNRTFYGRVQSLSSALDEASRTLTARCSVDNSHHLLRTGMYVQAALGSGLNSAVLAIPATALINNGTDQIVFVAVPGGYVKRTVTVKRVASGQAEIERGLSAGDRVVTAGALVLESESQKGDLKDTD